MSNSLRSSRIKEAIQHYVYPSDKFIKKQASNLSSNSSYIEKTNVLYQIVLWKLNREVQIDEETLNTLIEYAKNPDIQKNGLIEHEKLITVLNTLLVKKVSNTNKHKKLKGIGLPMISTILHFFNPSIFPIFDQRAYREIQRFNKEFSEKYLLEKTLTNNDKYKESKTKKHNLAQTYFEYINHCHEYHQKASEWHPFAFSMVDKILYQLDIDRGTTNKQTKNSQHKTTTTV